MSEYKRVTKIDLTEQEKLLYNQIPPWPFPRGTHYGPEKWELIADAMEALLESLEEREAIEPKRIAIFNDGNYAETHNKSIEEEMEQNGCSEPFRHPGFVEFLKYFIEGPDLPEEAMEGLMKVLDSICTSGMMVTRTQKHVRDMVRKYDLDQHHAGTQFFRFAVEIGMSATEAQGLRKAARSVK